MVDRPHQEIVENAKRNIKAAEAKIQWGYNWRFRTKPLPNYRNKRVWWKNVVTNQPSKLRDTELGPFVAHRKPSNPLF